jgi:hypothetical protein
VLDASKYGRERALAVAAERLLAAGFDPHTHTAEDAARLLAEARRGT